MENIQKILSELVENGGPCGTILNLCSHNVNVANIKADGTVSPSDYTVFKPCGTWGRVYGDRTHLLTIMGIKISACLNVREQNIPPQHPNVMWIVSRVTKGMLPHRKDFLVVGKQIGFNSNGEPIYEDLMV